MIEGDKQGTEIVQIDSEEKNKEKQKIDSFIKFYQKELVNVAISIETLETLLNNEENAVMLSKCSPAFFKALIHSFWGQSVIGLNECFRGKYCYGSLINYSKANWTKIFTERHIKTTKCGDGTEKIEEAKPLSYEEVLKRIKEAEKELECNNETIEKIKLFRNKVFAHSDEDDSVGEMRLNLSELRKVFYAAEKILSLITVAYNSTIYAVDPINSCDVKNLINIVREYMTYKDEIKRIKKETFKNT